LVKLFFVFCFCINALNATPLTEKIESFIGIKEYKIQKNLIHVLFKNEKVFLQDDGNVDDLKVLKQLKDSGLLKLFFKNPQELNLSFFTKDSPLIFMRVINDSLASMGYNYYLTKEIKKNNDGFLWEINLSTEHVVDPIYFTDRLKERGCVVDKINKENKHKWFYSINTENITILAILMDSDVTNKLKKPIKPYWVNVEDMKSISLRTRIADKWHPDVVFFDEKLNVVKDYRKDAVVNAIKIKVPDSAKYVKINDLYTLDNIKRGMSVYLKRRN